MILAVFSCLFVFLGMFIDERFCFKKFSISFIFGLFTLNCLSSTIPYSYLILYKNYHSSTWFFTLLSIILGYLLMKLINCKYEDCDNVSILGFSIVNTSLFVLHKFSFLFLIVNIFYYVLLVIYVNRSKSWIFVLVGCFFGIMLSFIGVWCVGYVYGLSIGFIVYYVLSVYGIVFRNNDKNSYISLILGFLIALLGGIL